MSHPDDHAAVTPAPEPGDQPHPGGAHGHGADEHAHAGHDHGHGHGRTGRGPGRGRSDGDHRPGGVLAALREGVVVVVAALVLSLLVKTFLAQAFYIPSESMEPTLIKNDRVVVSLLTPGPFDLSRGDVVVFADPGDWLDPAVEPDRGPVASAVVSALTFVGVLPQDSQAHLIKRVIGLPGDTVVCCDDQGRITVNGVAIDESYVYPGDAPSSATGTSSSDGSFSVVVPEGRIWVMGDHRSRSADSRFHQEQEGGGTVPISDVVGRAMVTVWPVSRWTWLGDHADVFADVPDPTSAQAAAVPAGAAAAGG